MELSKVICARCSSENYRTEQSGIHLKAICNDCNSYIKFLPQGIDENSEMFFGKYKGKKLKDIPPDYLIWLSDNANKLGGSLRQWLKDNRAKLLQKINESK